MATPADRSLVGVEGWEKSLCHLTLPRWGSAKDSDGNVDVCVAGKTTACVGCFAEISMMNGTYRS
jgi:hypothetical protein